MCSICEYVSFELHVNKKRKTKENEKVSLNTLSLTKLYFFFFLKSQTAPHSNTHLTPSPANPFSSLATHLHLQQTLSPCQSSSNENSIFVFPFKPISSLCNPLFQFSSQYKLTRTSFSSPFHLQPNSHLRHKPIRTPFPSRPKNHSNMIPSLPTKYYLSKVFKPHLDRVGKDDLRHGNVWRKKNKIKKKKKKSIVVCTSLIGGIFKFNYRSVICKYQKKGGYM